MAISLTCACGQKLKVKDEMGGRKAKCPGCQAILEVPVAAANGNGAGHGNGGANGKNAKAGKKSSLGLWIGAGVGVLLLGFCCVGTAGAGAWFFLLRGPSQDSRVVGKWVPDVEPPKKGGPKTADEIAALFGGDIQFKADGTVIDNTPMTPITQGKWRTVSSKGDVVTVELTQTGVSKKLDIKVVDNDHLKITPADSKMEFTFKRAS
jgi:hypothetical protein